ncbi:hypothetical protein TRAPUB_3644, partial [Trametes pubescens]
MAVVSRRLCVEASTAGTPGASQDAEVANAHAASSGATAEAAVTTEARSSEATGNATAEEPAAAASEVSGLAPGKAAAAAAAGTVSATPGLGGGRRTSLRQAKKSAVGVAGETPTAETDATVAVAPGARPKKRKRDENEPPLEAMT